VLSYYAHPHGPCRGTIYIALSAVSSNPNFCSINLDSGTATYHLKALTNEDFEKWMKIIRKYVNISKELQLNDPEYPKMTSPRQSTDFERRQSIYIKRQSLLLDRRNSLHRDPQSFFRLNNKLDEDIGKIYGTFNNMDNGFRNIKEVLDHFKNSVENLTSPGNTRQGPNAEGKFRLKKFPLSLQRGNQRHSFFLIFVFYINIHQSIHLSIHPSIHLFIYFLIYRLTYIGPIIITTNFNSNITGSNL
jgi:hypothetical protein